MRGERVQKQRLVGYGGVYVLVLILAVRMCLLPGGSEQCPGVDGAYVHQGWLMTVLGWMEGYRRM